MLSRTELVSIARAHLKDAGILFSRRRFDGALYLCGYAIEMALKARIVKTHKWQGFPDSRKEFDGLGSFKVHDLNMLLYLSGWEPKIRTDYAKDWSNVQQWEPESRYRPPGMVTEIQAKSMIDSAKKLVGALI